MEYANKEQKQALLKDATVLQTIRKAKKEAKMTYLNEAEWPEWIRTLFKKLSDKQRRKLWHPHLDKVKGRQLQEGMINALEASRNEGKGEEALLEQLRDYANTDWP